MENAILESIGFYLLRVVAAIVVLLFGRYLAGRFRNLTKEVLQARKSMLEAGADEHPTT